jgi:hypothetical protein
MLYANAKILIALGVLLLACVAAIVATTDFGPPKALPAAPAASSPPTAAPPAAAPGPASAGISGPPPASVPGPPGDGAWQPCPFDLPDGLGRLVLMCRPVAQAPERIERGLRIDVAPNATSAPLPTCSAATDRVNVYWYAVEGGRGPYVRLHDRECEVLVTLSARSRWTGLLVRVRGQVYVGPIKSGDDGFGWTDGPAGVEVKIGARKAYPIRNAVAEGPGSYLGRLERSGSAWRFLPAVTAAEEPVAAPSAGGGGAK